MSLRYAEEVIILTDKCLQTLRKSRNIFHGNLINLIKKFFYFTCMLRVELSREHLKRVIKEYSDKQRQNPKPFNTKPLPPILRERVQKLFSKNSAPVILTESYQHYYQSIYAGVYLLIKEITNLQLESYTDEFFKLSNLLLDTHYHRPNNEIELLKTRHNCLLLSMKLNPDPLKLQELYYHGMETVKTFNNASVYVLMIKTFSLVYLYLLRAATFSSTILFYQKAFKQFEKLFFTPDFKLLHGIMNILELIHPTSKLPRGTLDQACLNFKLYKKDYSSTCQLQAVCGCVLLVTELTLRLQCLTTTVKLWKDVKMSPTTTKVQEEHLKRCLNFFYVIEDILSKRPQPCQCQQCFTNEPPALNRLDFLFVMPSFFCPTNKCVGFYREESNEITHRIFLYKTKSQDCKVKFENIQNLKSHMERTRILNEDSTNHKTTRHGSLNIITKSKNFRENMQDIPKGCIESKEIIFGNLTETKIEKPKCSPKSSRKEESTKRTTEGFIDNTTRKAKDFAESKKEGLKDTTRREREDVLESSKKTNECPTEDMKKKPEDLTGNLKRKPEGGTDNTKRKPPVLKVPPFRTTKKNPPATVNSYASFNTAFYGETNFPE